MNDKKRQILIIEDDMQMRFYLMTLVKSLDMEPVLANDGDKGLEALETLRPAAIILDIMMPNKGGAAVYTRLLASESLKTIPVVFFSGVDKGAFLHYIRMLNSRENLSVPDPEYYVAKNADPQYLKTVLLKCVTPGGAASG